MDPNIEAKMDQSFDALLQMLKIFFDPHNNEAIKSFVTRHSHLLLPDYVNLDF